jgi:hypothetical protein
MFLLERSPLWSQGLVVPKVYSANLAEDPFMRFCLFLSLNFRLVDNKDNNPSGPKQGPSQLMEMKKTHYCSSRSIRRQKKSHRHGQPLRGGGD